MKTTSFLVEVKGFQMRERRKTQAGSQDQGKTASFKPQPLRATR